MAEDLIIGVDVGTTSVKAMLFSSEGSVLDGYSSMYPTQRKSGGIVEQNPDDWVNHIIAALEQFDSAFDLTRVRALGLCSQVNTHVFVDRHHRPLAPAIVWQDGRASDCAAELDGLVADADRLRWWGAPLPIDANHCLSRMKWMQAHQPDVWEKTSRVLLPKDYCLLKLTGEVATDPISSVGLINQNLEYVDELTGLVEGAAGRMAPLAGMTEIAGRIQPGMPGAGIPVAICTMDAWGGMLGVGVHEPGAAFYLSGTSEILGIVSDAIEPTPGVIAFPKCENIRLHVGPTQSGGASQLWCCHLLGITPEAMAALVPTCEHDRNVPLFVPHLQGERAPIWDADARGIFLDLDAGTGPAELARAVYEGVAFSARWVLETLQNSAALVPGELNCGGGGFQSDSWNQIRADVLQVMLKRVSVKDPGVLGAAGLATVACGIHPTLGDAFNKMVSIDCVYTPDNSRKAHYDAKYQRFKQAYYQNNNVRQ